MLITANQPFGEWNKVFPDPAMILAAVDRLVHHSTIFEMNVESYRRRTAMQRRSGPGRPAAIATTKNTELASLRDNQHEDASCQTSATPASSGRRDTPVSH